MTASFNCPHCEATYPSLPTLYGRTVRCSNCKKPFRLRGDGVVEKVEARKKDSASKRIERSEQEKEELTKAFLSKSKGEQQKPATKRIQKKREKSKTLSELKQSMSSALNAAASERIAKEAGKQAEAPHKKTASDLPRAISSAVLTNQGQREQKQHFVTYIICALILIGFFAMYSLNTTQSEEQIALSDFVAPTEQFNNPKKRELVYRQRQWLMSFDQQLKPSIIVNVDKADLKDVVEYDFTTAGTIIQDRLTGLSNYPKQAMWADYAQERIINELWLKHKHDAELKTFYAALTEKNIRFCSYKSFLDSLTEKNTPEHISFIVSALLSGSTDRGNKNKLSEKLLAGDVPYRLLLCEFSGSDGQELIVVGNNASYRTMSSYYGLLLKIHGDQWDSQWRIFNAQSSGVTIPNPLHQIHKKVSSSLYVRYQERNQQ